MAVNPNIALSVRGLELPDPLTQYGKVQSIQQMQQQNALAKMQMQQMENEFAQRNAMNQAYSQAYTPEGIDYNKLRQSAASLGQGSQIPQIEEQKLKFEKARTAQETADVELGTKKLEINRQALRLIASNDLAGYEGWLTRQYSDPQLREIYQESGVSLDQAIAYARQMAAEGKLPEVIRAAGMSYEKLQEFLKTSIKEVDTGTEKLLVETGPGQDPTVAARFTTEMTPAQQEQARINEEQLALAKQKMTLEQRRDAREEMKNTPQFKEAMARSEALGKEIAKNDVQALSQLPVITAKVEQGLDLINTMIGERDKNGNLLKGQAPHPGFSATVGATATPGARFVPGSSAADFMTYFDQITGQAFLEAFETLKGGGQITQIEGEKATSAINRMNIASSEREFIKAAMEFQDVMRAGLERAQKKAATAQQRMGTSIPSTGRFMGFD
jgi:hypothetical protein